MKKKRTCLNSINDSCVANLCCNVRWDLMQNRPPCPWKAEQQQLSGCKLEKPFEPSLLGSLGDASSLLGSLVGASSLLGSLDLYGERQHLGQTLADSLLSMHEQPVRLEPMSSKPYFQRDVETRMPTNSTFFLVRRGRRRRTSNVCLHNLSSSISLPSFLKTSDANCTSILIRYARNLSFM